MEASFMVPVSRVPELRRQFARLARRAARLGVSLPTLTVSDAVRLCEFTRVTEVDESHATRTERYPVRCVPVTLAGDEPVAPGGWHLVASLDALEGGTVVRGVPGEMVPEHYRHAAHWCDHCKAARRRTETFVLRNDAGEYRQVGRNCIAVFLGSTGNDLAAILLLAAELSMFVAMAGDSADGGSGTGAESIGLPEYLAYVVAVVREHGWMGRAKARETCRSATCDSAIAAMLAPDSKADVIRPTEADRVVADAALEWARGLPREGASDFDYNLAVVAGCDAVGWKHLGIAAYIPQGHHRATTVARERVEAPMSRHFGTVGERAVWTLEVRWTRALESAFGLTTLVAFRTPEGNRAKWFCSGEAPAWVTEGAAVTVKATVKDHGEYNGARETTLSRVAEYTPPPPKAPRGRKSKAAEASGA